ncbi:MAG: outer membrane beta-barrel protein [Pseudomonadota bacterium]
MIKQSLLALALAGLAGPALAQSGEDSANKWSGFYVGGNLGNSDPRGGDDATILFDTNLDGTFGDTVRTTTGADAFAPGFCGGASAARTPAGGCFEDNGGMEYGVRAGYDWQMGNLVFGLVGEYTNHDARDSVSAFSVTPAFYYFTRDLTSSAAIRGRVGLAFGQQNDWLGYVTAGAVRGRLENEFETSNTANSFTLDGSSGLTNSSDASGVQAGIGVERKIVNNFSVGLEYLRTRLEDEDTRVRVARGAAPATSPFILVNANGTDFRRSDEDFDIGSVRLTVNYRF